MLFGLAVLAAAAVAYWFWPSADQFERDQLAGHVSEYVPVPPATAGDANGPRAPLDEQPVVPETHEQLTEAMLHEAEQLVARFPKDPLVHDLLGRVYSYLGKSAEASAAWQRCLQLNADRPDALHGLAQLAIKRGDDSAARPLLERVLAIDPKYPQAASQLAELLMRQQQPDQAESALQQYLQRVPSSVAAWLQLAQVQQQAAEYERAEKSFRQVVTLDTNSTEGYLGLGTVVMRQGRRDEAKEHLERSRELRTSKGPVSPRMAPEEFDLTMMQANYASSKVYAAEIYRLHGELSEAVRLCRQAAAADAKNLPARLKLISLYKQLGRLPAAIQVGEATLAADPENPELLWRLGVLQAQAGRFADAEPTLKELIRLAPDQPRGYAGLAEVYLEWRRELSEALRLIRKAIRLEPAAIHYVLLGRIQLQQGDVKQAKQSLAQALELDPENAVFRQLYQQWSVMYPGD
jgi:tetratricopeptide (TPR) repeat protein